MHSSEEIAQLHYRLNLLREQLQNDFNRVYQQICQLQERVMHLEGLKK